MRTIHKYTLTPGARRCFEIPKDAKPLAVGHQDGTICLWVELDTEQPAEGVREFSVVGTGWELCGKFCKTYVGTVQVGAFVWHVYETE